MKKTYVCLGCILSLMAPTMIYAICPLCTIAVGAGVGFSEWLGIDDAITGLWIGGLVMSLVIWTVHWLDNKNIKFTGRKILVTFSYYAIVIIPLYPLGYMGKQFNTLWGIDKLLWGIIVGSILFLIGAVWYEALKKRHGGHAYFPLQKVVMPVAPLVILSILLHFILR